MTRRYDAKQLASGAMAFYFNVPTRPFFVCGGAAGGPYLDSSPSHRPPLVCVRKRLGLVAGAAGGQREHAPRSIRESKGPDRLCRGSRSGLCVGGLARIREALAPRPARPAFVGSNSQALQLTKGRPAIN